MVEKVSEEKANLAKQDAAAPKAPLKRAKGANEDDDILQYSVL